MGIHISGAVQAVRRLLDLLDTPDTYNEGKTLISSSDKFVWGTAMMSNPPIDNHPVLNIYVTADGKLAVQFDDGT